MPGPGEEPGKPHRPLPAAAAHRRGRFRHRVRGRTAGTGHPPGGAEDHQAGHGHQGGDRAVRGRTPGPGPDGPPAHRQGPGCRGHRNRQAVLRDGAGPGPADHRILRPSPVQRPAAPGTVLPGLPCRPARPPEGDHPPRHQTVKCPGGRRRRPARPQGDRLRYRQGHQPAAHRKDLFHRAQADYRYTALHEPRAGGPHRPRRGHPQRHLLPGRPALRAARPAPPRSAPKNCSAPASARSSASSARRIRRGPAPAPAPSAPVSTRSPRCAGSGAIG